MSVGEHDRERRDGHDPDDTFDVGPGGDPRHPVPAAVPAATGPAATADHLDDRTVEALGALSEAVEWIERARGHLYEFHQLTGHADGLLGEAAEALARAGHGAWAQRIRDDLVGRNVLDGRWTFQVVDEYDDTYWTPVREMRRAVESDLAGGVRHVHEARMKERRRTHGRRHHEATPPSRSDG